MRSARTTRCPTCHGLFAPAGPEPVDVRIQLIRAVALELQGCHEDAWRFFRTLIENEDVVTKAYLLSQELGVEETALRSRFFRAGLPSMKSYTAALRVVLVCDYLQLAERTLTDCAYTFGYSSAQSMNRSIRGWVSLSATELRQQHTTESIVAWFVDTMIKGHRALWMQFRPLVNLPATAKGQRMVAAGAV